MLLPWWSPTTPAESWAGAWPNAAGARARGAAMVSRARRRKRSVLSGDEARKYDDARGGCSRGRGRAPAWKERRKSRAAGKHGAADRQGSRPAVVGPGAVGDRVVERVDRDRGEQRARPLEDPAEHDPEEDQNREHDVHPVHEPEEHAVEHRGGP